MLSFFTYANRLRVYSSNQCRHSVHFVNDTQHLQFMTAETIRKSLSEDFGGDQTSVNKDDLFGGSAYHHLEWGQPTGITTVPVVDWLPAPGYFKTEAGVMEVHPGVSVCD